MMKLLESQNQLLKRYIKSSIFNFIIGGALNTVFTYIIYITLLLLFDYISAYTISFVLGILFSFIINSKYVFKVSIYKKTMLLYPIIYLVQYFLSVNLLIIFVEKFGFSKALSPIIVVFILLPITYILNKTFFKKF